MIAALMAQSETSWRLTVFDNASEPDQRPAIAELPPGATIIQSEINLGFAEANNRAASEVESRYLVFLNPDAFPEPDWLAQLVATADRLPQAAAIGSTQVRADAPDLFDGVGDVMHASGLAYRAGYGQKRTTPPPLGECFAACAAAMLVRREAFESAGGFDARYFCYFEDVDLCFRLRLAGWSIVQSPDAIAAHIGGGVANASSAFAQFHGARNRLWTFVKCMPAPLFWPLLPVHLLLTSAAATIALLAGRGFAAWRGLAAGVAGLAETWRTRREIQRGRTVSAGEIARMLAWSPLVFIGRRPLIRPLR
jgi:GT2 family glycosyltransferase